MINNEIFKVNIEIILNQKLLKKNIIDDDTYIKVNEILLKKLKELLMERVI